MPKKHITLTCLVSLFVLFVLIRLAMPYAILHYVERRFEQIPDYKVQIADLDVHLWRGAYVIKHLQLQKVTRHIPVPFFSAERIDLAVQWSALLKGSFVAQIDISQPTINFVLDSKGNNEQLTIDQEWQNVVKSLFPLNFNRVSITNGKLSLRSYTAKPPFNLYLREVTGELNNFHNAEKIKENLASRLQVHAKSMDGAPVSLKMKFDPFAQQPTFKLEAKLDRMHIPEANNFIRHFSKIKISDGFFSLYIEAAAKQGKIVGYAKPIIEQLKIIDSKEDLAPVEALYKGALQLISNILENRQKQTVATKINITGDIENPDISLWSVIVNLLHHAFIQALLPQVDHTIKMRDVELK